MGNSTRRSKGATEAQRPQPDEPCQDEQLLRALNHRMRRQILRLLHSSPAPLSPCQIERELRLGRDPGRKLSDVSYHVRALADFNAVSLVDTKLVRGATEHFYTSQVGNTAWLCGLLSRTQQSDEAMLWPNGRGREARKAPGSAKR